MKVFLRNKQVKGLLKPHWSNSVKILLERLAAVMNETRRTADLSSRVGNPLEIAELFNPFPNNKF